MLKKNKIKKKLLSAKHERTRTGRKPVRGHSKRTSFKKANFFTPPLSCHSLSLSITTLPPPPPPPPPPHPPPPPRPPHVTSDKLSCPETGKIQFLFFVAGKRKNLVTTKISKYITKRG